MAIAIAIAAAIVFVGGATRSGQALVAVIAAVGLSSTIRSRRVFERWSPLLVLLLAAAAWTAVQLLPLPDGLVHAFSPTLTDLRNDGATHAGVGVWSTLSMDPPATLRALTFLLTLSGLAFVALRLSVSERGRYLMMACVAGLAGLTALITGLHELFGATSLYGIYRPHQAAPPIMGPLLNANHLGCLMAVGAAASLGLLLYPKQSSIRRASWALVGLGCLAVTTATLSRGAIIAVTAGLIVTLATIVAQRVQALDRGSRRRRERFIVTTVPIGIVIACGLTVTVYLGADSVMQQLQNTSLEEIHEPKSKFAAWRSSLTLIEESPWVGVGRGAFESTFTRVHPASAFATFSHAENEPLQAVVEWGIPAMLVLGLLAVWLIVLAIRRWKDGPLAAGALGVLVTVALQSNFDFGMELLGLAAPVTVVVCTLAYVPLREVASRRSPRAQVTRMAHALMIFGGAAVLMLDATRSVEEDHIALRESPSKDMALVSIGSHPLDYFGYAVLAEQMVRMDDPNAIRMLNHALRLHPTHPGLHRIAARLLVRTGRLSQAESEYSTTARYSTDPRLVIGEITKVLSPEGAARAIPLDLEIDKTVRSLQEHKRIDVAILWLDRVLSYTRSLRAAETLYAVAMGQKNYGAAERAARVRCQTIPSRHCQLALARVLTLAARPKDVVIELRDVATWIGRRDDQLTAWLMLCDAYTSLSEVSDARDCLRRLEASGLVRPGANDVQRRRDALPLEHGTGHDAGTSPPAFDR